MLVPFLLILFLFGVALGICTSAVVLRLGPSAEWFVWPVPAVVSPFAGGPVPGTSLRKGIQRVRTNFCTVQADRPILLKWSIDATQFQAIISDSSR
jgi:hypothetical protein